jgi:hypothetical protein
MRLIDADALKASYVVTSTTTNSLCHLYVSIEDINSAPTIDAVEVAYGEWIPADGVKSKGKMIGTTFVLLRYFPYKCSVCGAEVNDMPNSLYQFCPNCGADMRGAINGNK